MNSKVILISLFVLTFFNHNSSYGAKNQLKSDQTRITSNIIDIKKKTQIVEFIDNVVVKNGPDMMTSKKMTIYYLDDKKPVDKNEKNSAIDKIVANGEVKVFSADFVATSDSGYYNPNKAIFVMQDNVVVNNGNSIGTGDKFIYDLNTRKGNFVSEKLKNNNNESDKKNKRVKIILDKNAQKPSKKDK